MEKTGVSAIVEYDYTAKESDELTLKRGTTITNIKIQPGGWWEGTLTATGRTGMFPDNFVRVLEPDDKNPVVLRDKTAALNRRCKVIYSYQENKPDELTLAVGDVVEIFEEVEEGWWRGKLNGKVGVFPSNFVELIESASPMSANRKSSTGGPPKATAGGLLLDGGGSNSIGSLSKSNSLNKSRSSLTSSRENLDDVISNQQQLLFDAPSLPPKPVRDLCKVLFAYAPANEDELRLVEGDIITILSKELPDKGWWKGELKGRVGVFPDNFVVVLPPEVSPVKESSFHPKPERPPPSNKILIGKQNNNQPGTTNAYRKESFGSKDSLNEPAANNQQVAGSPAIGNVAAHRRSLETRNVENHATTTNNSNASPVLAPVTEKPPRKSLDGKSSEIRKSLENLDDKKGTPPPVLGKKPQVPIKKSPSITSVTGNLFSGLKQKVKGGDGKHQDGTDGVGGSRMKSDVADNNDRNVSGERLSRDESEFGHVERGSVLKDMRANRAKAPKRRPPTSAGSILGESPGSNGLSNGNSGLFHQLSQSGAEPESPKPDLLNVSQLSNSNDEEFIAKPKAREWEKHKVPWMDELKASQAKKTSPNVSESKSPEQHRDSVTSSNNLHHQLLEESTKFDNISKSFHQSSTTSVASVAASGRARLSERAATTSSVADVTSSTANSVNNNNNNSSFDLIASSRKETTNSHHQHSLTNSSVEQQHSSSISTSSTTTNTTTTSNNVMTKSMSALSTKIAISSDSGATGSGANDVPTSTNSSNRPVSVNLRNRSISPTPITRNTKTIHITSTTAAAATSGGPTMVAEAAPTNNGTSTTAIGGGSAGTVVVTSDNVCSRVQDLEQKVNRMDRQLTTQNNLIEDLKRLLREESDRVKTLQKELEKYAQCVTQV